MIPKRMQPYISIRKEHEDNYSTISEGNLQCCDQNIFSVKTRGMITGLLHHSLQPQNEEMSMVASCIKCQRKIIVFDYKYDGYDRQTENESKVRFDAEAIDKTLNNCKCPKCKSENYSIAVKYEYPDLAELESLELMDCTNAYTWIVVTLAYCNCGKKMRRFIDLETG